MHAAGLGHLHLAAHRVGRVEAVEAEVARHARLVVAAETRQAARDVGPFGEAGAPPGVVLGEGVELRQVVGEQLDAARGALGQRAELLEVGARAGEALHLARDAGLVLRHPAVHAGLVAVRDPVGERVLRHIAAQVALHVEAHVELGRGVAPLAPAVEPEMLERIDAGGGDVRVVLQVVADVELQDRAEAPGGAVRQVVRQRPLARRDGVALAVPGRVEERASAAAFEVAVEGVVEQRVEVVGGDVRIPLDVPERVEVGVGEPALAEAVVEEVIERVDAGLGDVRVGREVVARVEQAGLAQRREARGAQQDGAVFGRCRVGFGLGGGASRRTAGGATTIGSAAVAAARRRSSWAKNSDIEGAGGSGGGGTRQQGFEVRAVAAAAQAVSAAAAIARAEAAGLRLYLGPDGQVKMQAAAPPPPDVLADLRRWRDDVTHLLAARAAVADPPAEAPAAPAPAHAPPPGPDAWLGSIARSIRAALADGAVRAADEDGWLVLVRPDGRRTVVAPDALAQITAAGLLPDLPAPVVVEPGVDDPVDRAERAAIQAEPALPPEGSPERAATDRQQADEIAGLLAAALSRPPGWSDVRSVPPPGRGVRAAARIIGPAGIGGARRRRGPAGAAAPATRRSIGRRSTSWKRGRMRVPASGSPAHDRPRCTDAARRSRVRARRQPRRQRDPEERRPATPAPESSDAARLARSAPIPPRSSGRAAGRGCRPVAAVGTVPRRRRPDTRPLCAGAPGPSIRCATDQSIGADCSS
jgi:hypothetical protein